MGGADTGRRHAARWCQPDGRGWEAPCNERQVRAQRQQGALCLSPLCLHHRALLLPLAQSLPAQGTSRCNIGEGPPNCTRRNQPCTRIDHTNGPPHLQRVRPQQTWRPLPALLPAPSLPSLPRLLAAPRPAAQRAPRVPAGEERYIRHCTSMVGRSAQVVRAYACGRCWRQEGFNIFDAQGMKLKLTGIPHAGLGYTIHGQLGNCSQQWRHAQLGGATEPRPPTSSK